MLRRYQYQRDFRGIMATALPLPRGLNVNSWRILVYQFLNTVLISWIYTIVIAQSIVGLRTGSRFLLKTVIWGSIDKSNRKFVFQTKYQTSIWEGLKRLLLPKICCFRHKFQVISHQNSVACILFHVSHSQSLFCQQQTGNHIFCRGSGSSG